MFEQYYNLKIRRKLIYQTAWHWNLFLPTQSIIGNFSSVEPYIQPIDKFSAHCVGKILFFFITIYYTKAIVFNIITDYTMDFSICPSDGDIFYLSIHILYLCKLCTSICALPTVIVLLY